MITINEQILTSIISATAIIIGSLLGALFTWIITSKATRRNIEEQHRILMDKRRYEEFDRYKEICRDSNIIRCDIYNAIFQSIRAVKYSNLNEGNFVIYPIVKNKDYVKTIATICERFSLKELSYIYQFYGVIEVLNNQILRQNFDGTIDDKHLLQGYIEVLKKIYGKNYEKIINWDVEHIEYIDLMENDEIKNGYKIILKKLNDLCQK